MGEVMFGIQLNMVKDLAVMLGGYLLVAVFAGFSLLKFYEEFRKGVEQKNRLRIWSVFFGLSFVILVFSSVIARTPK